MAHKLAHSLLEDGGVYYDTEDRYNNYRKITRCIGDICDLCISGYRWHAVEQKLNNLDFRSQVAVCDIGAGDHSILITNRSDAWFECFDPYWEYVQEGRRMENRFETLPSEPNTSTNVKIHKDHLSKPCNERHFTNERINYIMGAINTRYLTVIEHGTR